MGGSETPGHSGLSESASGGKSAKTRKDGFGLGFLASGLSLFTAALLTTIYVALVSADLETVDASAGLARAYAGLAIVYVAVLIFLGVLIALGLFLLIFFLATDRKKAMTAAAGQLVIGGVLLALFLAYLAS
jgi:hypothetical protein